jgi:signal peptidase I
MDARGPLRRGDVVRFEHPCTPGAKLVERVVALAGDSVEIRCSLLYIDGAAVANELLADGAQCAGCSRYRERLGEATYDILDAPDRPERDGEESSRDFPKVERETVALPGCGSEAIGTIEVIGSARRCDSQARFVVPEGTVFVLGDDRASASDSRLFGPVAETAILGVAAR